MESTKDELLTILPPTHVFNKLAMISFEVCSFLSGMFHFVVFMTERSFFLVILKKQVFGLHQSFLSLKTLDIAWMEICMILRHLDIMLTYSVHLGLTRNFEHLSHFHFPKIALKEMLWRRIRGKCISISKAALFNRFI